MLVFNQLPNELDAQLMFLEMAIAHGGLEASPVARAYIKRLEAGTMPCGWTGPLSKDGGKPEIRLRDLHLQRA